MGQPQLSLGIFHSWTQAEEETPFWEKQFSQQKKRSTDKTSDDSQCCCSELARVTSVHISLAKANLMAKPGVSEHGNATLLKAKLYNSSCEVDSLATYKIIG